MAEAATLRPSVEFRSGSGAIDQNALHVRHVAGREAISEPYHFDLELLAGTGDVDLDELLHNTCSLSMRQPVKLGEDRWGTKVLPFHGELSDIEFVERSDNTYIYRARMVPRIWKLSLNHVSRIFQEKTIMDIVTEILAEIGLDAHMEDLTEGDHPTREYVVQYEESDLDFIHRWLEHEGIFYYFKQTESGETIVFADSTAGYAPIEQPNEVRFNASVQGSSRVVDHDDEAASFYREPMVSGFSLKKFRRQAKVTMQDYNWRTPAVSLVAEHDVDPDKGTGVWYEFNAHYKDEGEGAVVAQIRAEEILCRKEIYRGASDFRSFHPGFSFSLAEHFMAAYNQEYVLIEVEHEAEQELGAIGMRLVSPHSARYSNKFRAIKSDVVFRPKSVTAWPTIHGFLNAHIDAAGSGDYAEIDDLGRYKVKFPFDLSGESGGAASRFVRMAQPYAGGGMGMHFPLHKGTEVIIAFVDGDPDRPIIIGAVPNAETVGPVTGGNQTQCAIHTGGGNQIVIEDTDGTQSITVSTPAGGTYLSLGKG